MRSGIGRRMAPALVAAAMLAATVSACGSSGSSSGASADSGGGATSAPSADIAGARKLIAPYVGHPNAFPVDRPLPKPLAAGTRMAYLQCGTPACGIFAELFQAAGTAVGAQVSTVKAGGSTTEALQGAMSSILEKRPDGVLLPGIEPASIRTQLAQARSQGIPMSADGISGADQYGIGANVLGEPAQETIGKLLAGWVVDRKGAHADTVLYTAPELSFSAPIKHSFVDEMSRLCRSCHVRVVDVPAASIGTTAPNTVVSDLQRNPGSNVAVFVPQEIESGLPAALKTAGLHITQVGFGPTPPVLADIKRGAIDSGLGMDLATMAWTQVDALARLIEHAPLTAGERSTIPVMQFLEAKNLPGDVSKGWTGYPDFAQRFQKLWNAAG